MMALECTRDTRAPAGGRTAEVIEQKADYLHDNPVVSGYVTEAWHWKYSSAIDYSGGKGLIEIAYL